MDRKVVLFVELGLWPEKQLPPKRPRLVMEMTEVVATYSGRPQHCCTGGPW